jgi:hypothetical protein
MTTKPTIPTTHYNNNNKHYYNTSTNNKFISPITPTPTTLTTTKIFPHHHHTNNNSNMLDNQLIQQQQQQQLPSSKRVETMLVLEAKMGGFSPINSTTVIKQEDRKEKEVRVHHDALLAAVQRREWAASDLVAGDMDDFLMSEELEHLEGIQFGIIAEGRSGAFYANFITEHFPSTFVRISCNNTNRSNTTTGTPNNNNHHHNLDIATILSDTIESLNYSYEKEAREKQDLSLPYGVTVILVKGNELYIVSTGNRRSMCVWNGVLFLVGEEERKIFASPRKSAINDTIFSSPRSIKSSLVVDSSPATTTSTLTTGTSTSTSSNTTTITTSTTMNVATIRNNDYRRNSSPPPLVQSTNNTSTKPHVFKHVLDLPRFNGTDSAFVLACTNDLWDALTPREMCDIVEAGFKVRFLGVLEEFIHDKNNN